MTILKDESASEIGMRVRRRALRQLTRFQPDGTPIYDREWDLLVVLDACRLDLMRDVADEYEFIERVDSEWSVNSMTHAWMKENFSDSYTEEMAETVHVTGSPYSDIELDPTDFAVLDEVWKVGWDHDAGTIPPRPITDRAIEHHRKRDPERLLVHYMQPHHPFLDHPELDKGQKIDSFQDEEWKNIWGKLSDGEVSEERVWTAYRDNLRSVLDDVEILLQSVDAQRVVITSDHGNSFGTWGIYGHPMHMPLYCLREVPWIVTSAADNGSYTPDTSANEIDSSVSRRLEQLGYK